MARAGGNPNIAAIGRATAGKSNAQRGAQNKKKERLTKLVNRIFEMRERGARVHEIARECSTTESRVHIILQSPENVANRIKDYQEKLRAATPKAIEVIHQVLGDQNPRLIGERATMARWVLEMTKVVGKDAPVNIFVGAGGQVNLNQEEIAAARAIADQMRRALPPAPTQDSRIANEDAIDAEIIVEAVVETIPANNAEETVDEHRTQPVGIAPTDVGGEPIPSSDEVQPG